jgi:predicted AlkP superfamily phosphohydrolase/phosphomutase
MIGLDGATWDNLMPWIIKGELPLFRELIHKGLRGTCKSTIPSTTCPALPSFYTGLHPTKTKVFGFRNKEGRIITSNKIRGKRFWDVMCEKGVKCFVSGVVTTYPAFIPENGVLVTDPFLAFKEEGFIFPDYEQDKFKGYIMDTLNRQDMLKWQKNDRTKLLNHYLDDESRRFNLIREYLEVNQFDFKLIYFISTDRIQHQLWNNQELILEAYKQAEKWIGELMKMYSDHNFIIFSDHGFGPVPKKAFYINSWLMTKKRFIYKNKTGKLFDGLMKKFYYAGGFGLERYLPINLYEKFYRFFRGQKKGVSDTEFHIEGTETDMRFVNTDKTTVFLDQKWGLKIINTIDYEEVRDKVIKEMMESGYFEEVYKKEELYNNAEIYTTIPDIIFRLKPGYEVRTGFNKNIVEDITFKTRYEGSHDFQREGIFIAFGPDISKKGTKDINIYDLAPSVLKLYGLEADWMDGESIW